MGRVDLGVLSGPEATLWKELRGGTRALAIWSAVGWGTKGARRWGTYRTAGFRAGFFGGRRVVSFSGFALTGVAKIAIPIPIASFHHFTQLYRYKKS